MTRTFYSERKVKWVLRFSLLMLGFNVLLIFIILDIYSELGVLLGMIDAFLQAQS